jgi:hypothetical protein
VTLAGIDSVMAPRAVREAAWARLALDLDAAQLSRMTREVGLPILSAIDAFGRGDYADTVSLLLPVRYKAHAFGGRHAQRDIVHRTLIEATLRGGDRAMARALTRERTAQKPHCAFGWGLRQRVA